MGFSLCVHVYMCVGTHACMCMCVYVHVCLNVSSLESFISSGGCGHTLCPLKDRFRVWTNQVRTWTLSPEGQTLSTCSPLFLPKGAARGTEAKGKSTDGSDQSCHLASNSPTTTRDFGGSRLHFAVFLGLVCLSAPLWAKGFLVAQTVKDACPVGDLGSIPGWGRCPGERNDYPLQYSCPENPTDRVAWQATVQGVSKNRTCLSA